MNQHSLPKRDRRYLPTNFRITVWSKVKPYFSELQRRPINSAADLKEWLLDLNELEQILTAEINTRRQAVSDPDTEAAYSYLMEEVAAKAEEIQKSLYTKWSNSPYLEELPKEADHQPRFSYLS